ncbi:MAG: L-serine ammonia-lyase [Oleiphilaceae bacterium]|nr:L-serine ammonia-lyase [Oleiphilaceae bacterium]
MSISVFDLFKIGIGPSSSHTVGPMRAAWEFTQVLCNQGMLEQVGRLEIHLFGSLSATGLGHGTDKAILMGLMGEQPQTIDPAIIGPAMEQMAETQTLPLNGHIAVSFDPGRDIYWHQENLPHHPNAMQILVWSDKEELYRNTYYSVGGGFVIDEAQSAQGDFDIDSTPLPYEFNTAAQLLALCQTQGMSISTLMMENEKAWREESEIRSQLLEIWQVMKTCVLNGLAKDGMLPGELRVRRRSAAWHLRLLNREASTSVIASTGSAMDWLNLFALAVNEENAAGGRMVTAPTNGAAGIIPAVLHYYMQFQPGASESDVVDFMLAAAAVGILCKKNASISGAEVGCQGEVGSACAMAAAGLAEVLGGTPAQVENAAEIGLEHNLGLTCDPIGGLVQVPCIERNAIASVKAVNAAHMALAGDGEHVVSLDKVIRTMRETGRDMHDKYKETSRGGLAVNIVEC